MERRWKRIADGNFEVGDILVLYEDDGSSSPYMKNPATELVGPSQTDRMVEIDQYRNTIRTYKCGDKLNEGTVIGGIMNNKEEARKRLDAIEAEAKALRKLIDKPERIVYDKYKLYVLVASHVLPCILFDVNGEAHFMDFNGSSGGWNSTPHTGQELLDSIRKISGCTIHEFTNRDDAFKFMMEQK
jgi:hypothetical protein